MMPAGWKQAVREHGMLAALLLLGFVLRFLGLGFGDPFRYHPDEMKLVFHAGNILDYHSWSSETFFLLKGYPPLYAFLLAGAFLLYILGLMISGTATSMAAVKVWYYLHPFHFHMVGRWLSLLAGVATILVIYHTGKRLYSRQAGLWAAAFWAVTFLPVKNAHFGTVDILLTLLTSISFYYSVRILQEGQLRHYLGAAIFAGVAVATKYNAGLILLPVIAAHWMTRAGRVRPGLVAGQPAGGSGPKWQAWAAHLWAKLWDRRIWLAALATIAAFLIACPLPLVDFGRFWASVVGTAEFEQTGKLGSGGSFFSYFTGDHSPGYGFFFDNTFPASLGWGVTLLFIAGMVWMFWRRRREDWLVVLFPIVLYAVIGQMAYKAMRHLLPLVPFLLLIASEVLAALARQISSNRKRMLFYVIIAGLAIAPQLWKSLRYDLALYQTDTRTRLKEWIEAHLPADTRIGTEEFAPPLLSIHDLNLEIIRKSPDYRQAYDLFGLVPKMFAHGKQRTADHDASRYVMQQGIEYIVLDGFTRARYGWPQSRERYPDRVAQRDDFYRWISENCELVRREVPGNKLNISPELELYRVKRGIIKP